LVHGGSHCKKHSPSWRFHDTLGQIGREGQLSRGSVLQVASGRRCPGHVATLPFSFSSLCRFLRFFPTRHSFDHLAGTLCRSDPSCPSSHSWAQTPSALVLPLAPATEATRTTRHGRLTNLVPCAIRANKVSTVTVFIDHHPWTTGKRRRRFIGRSR
jgi:hypothetical protein